MHSPLPLCAKSVTCAPTLVCPLVPPMCTIVQQQTDATCALPPFCRHQRKVEYAGTFGNYTEQLWSSQHLCFWCIISRNTNKTAWKGELMMMVSLCNIEKFSCTQNHSFQQEKNMLIIIHLNFCSGSPRGQSRVNFSILFRCKFLSLS